MEKSREEELEIFVKKTVREAGVESPSHSFTDSVLDKIAHQIPSGATPYKPIISQKHWILTILLATAIVVLVLLSGATLSTPWLASFEIPDVSNGLFDSIAAMKISNTYLYGVVGFTFFMGVQVFVLRNHINKRYAM